LTVQAVRPRFSATLPPLLPSGLGARPSREAGLWFSRRRQYEHPASVQRARRRALITAAWECRAATAANTTARPALLGLRGMRPAWERGGGWSCRRLAGRTRSRPSSRPRLPKSRRSCGAARRRRPRVHRPYLLPALTYRGRHVGTPSTAAGLLVRLRSLEPSLFIMCRS